MNVLEFALIKITSICDWIYYKLVLFNKFCVVYIKFKLRRSSC